MEKPVKVEMFFEGLLTCLGMDQPWQGLQSCVTIVTLNRAKIIIIPKTKKKMCKKFPDMLSS